MRAQGGQQRPGTHGPMGGTQGPGPQAPRGLAHKSPVGPASDRPTRDQGGPQGLGPQGPRGAYKGAQAQGGAQGAGPQGPNGGPTRAHFLWFHLALALDLLSPSPSTSVRCSQSQYFACLMYSLYIVFSVVFSWFYEWFLSLSSS